MYICAVTTASVITAVVVCGSDTMFQTPSTLIIGLRKKTTIKTTTTTTPTTTTKQKQE